MAIAILIALSVALAGLVLLPRLAPTSPICKQFSGPGPVPASPIKHIFVVVKENHAFENYFGSYPGVTGYPANGSFPVSFTGSGVVQPFALTGDSTPDLPHDHQSDLVDLDGGRNDLFVAQANASGALSPEDAVGYYTAKQLSSYYAYAHYYGIGDEFFSGVLGPTWPNRVFNIAAYTGSWNSDTPPTPDVTSHQTILDQLTYAGIPWEYDYAGSLAQLAPSWFPSLTGDPCSLSKIVPISGLSGQLSGSNPPSVVFVDPSSSLTYSEHPPESVTLGEQWTVSVVNSILKSAVGNSSMILISYDENGGFWDPVTPPITSTGSDGFRTPLIVISPWTEGGTVCHTILDPAATLHLIDANWNLPFLNSRVAAAANLSCFLNFGISVHPPLILPSNVILTSRAPPNGSGIERIPGRPHSALEWFELRSSEVMRWNPNLSVAQGSPTAANRLGAARSPLPPPRKRPPRASKHSIRRQVDGR